MAWAALAVAGSGVLLSVPPVSLFIYPIYRQVHAFHGWFSLAVALPFAVTLAAHGLPAWRARGFVAATRSGLALGIGFPLALASGVYHMQRDDTAPWVLLFHFAVGIAALVAAYVHGRLGGARQSGQQEAVPRRNRADGSRHGSETGPRQRKGQKREGEELP